MDFLEYVIKEALILIPVLFIIGMWLKSTPRVDSWMIPWVLGLLGIIGALFLVGFDVRGVIQGILVAGVTVYSHQLITQTRDR